MTPAAVEDDSSVGDDARAASVGDDAEAARRRYILKEAKKLAPDEIRSSAELAVDAFLGLVDLEEAADFDVEQVDESASDALFTPEVNAAIEAISEWYVTNCSM